MYDNHTPIQVLIATFFKPTSGKPPATKSKAVAEDDDGRMSAPRKPRILAASVESVLSSGRLQSISICYRGLGIHHSGPSVLEASLKDYYYRLSAAQ